MILDNVVSVLAPFSCLGCQQKGYVLCPSCQISLLDNAPSRCYRCHKATLQYQVCKNCRKSVSLTHAWVFAHYTGLAKEAVELMKFERAGAVSKDIARGMSELLPLLPTDTIICHVPTAPKRIRVRGYDQSKLIVGHISKTRGLEFLPLLRRVSSSRQLGVGREERFSQANQAFAFNPKYPIEGRNILLVDDVTTSGATIEACAKLLKTAGAKTIDAVVFAQAID